VAEASAVELSSRIKGREVSAEETVAAALGRIEELNPELNAFIHLAPEEALKAARALDGDLASGRAVGPLAGVPFGVKDNTDCAGMPTAHGSAVHAGEPPKTRDAPFVERLRRAGAIPLGKTAIPEFAMDSLTHSPAFGVTRNPWDPSLTPGGSSGGSAAAVASGMVPIATGSDIGGSIRSPAALTGLLGLMPTHGRIPFPPPVDLDVLGPLARTAADAARIIDVSSGPHPSDRNSLPADPRSFEAALDEPLPGGLRACWSGDLGFAVVEAELLDGSRRAAEELCEAAGIELVELGFAPPNPYLNFLETEAYEIAARLRATGLFPDRAEDLAPFTREIVTDLAPDRDTWMRARIQREEIVAATAELFEEVDLLMTPTVACATIEADGSIPDVIEGRDASGSGAEPFTMLANMCWQPAVSIPGGMTSSGLPIGLQVVGRRFEESLLLQLARVMERTHPWPLTAPRAVEPGN